MTTPTRRQRLLLGLQIGMAALGGLAALILLILARGERPATEAEPDEPAAVAPDSEEAETDWSALRQVTVFAIRATDAPGSVDPRLSTVRVQLRKMLPNHGFQLIEARSQRLGPGETLTCDLGEGREAQTTLVAHPEDGDRVQFQCRLIDGGAPVYSNLVDAPENQLFFYERALSDGTLVLIGVGAR